jgi:peptidoglycan/xylan/chitin deacetylase (PgdA/CDA1 family)
MFALSYEGIEIRGELQSHEQRRGVWWDMVKKLSRVNAETRRAFVKNSAQQLGVHRINDDRTSLDLKNGVEERDSAQVRRFGLMTVRELRTLAAAGMTIGAHTMSHPLLSQMAPELAQAEIMECRIKLAAALQTNVWAFAYPFGDAASVTPQVLAMPKEAGYDAAFLNVGGGLGAELPPYALPRLHVTAEMSLSEFEAHVAGFYSRLQRHVGRSAPVLEAAPH